MFNRLKKFATGFALTAGVCFASALAYAQTELTMYYPVAVGGPLTKIVDGIVDDFMRENPDIKVSAIYAGNYNDARIKALRSQKKLPERAARFNACWTISGRLGVLLIGECGVHVFKLLTH